MADGRIATDNEKLMAVFVQIVELLQPLHKDVQARVIKSTCILLEIDLRL